MKLSYSNQILLNDFRRKHGRSPRILHIGNIANNAYNNAKILNEAGFDCDVICYDYYHIMACPEWEDAQTGSEDLDSNRPDWCKIDLHGYERPRWFVQGPIKLCFEYLNARRSGRNFLAEKIWGYLGVENKTKSSSYSYRWFYRSVKWFFGANKRIFSDPLVFVLIWNELKLSKLKFGVGVYLGAFFCLPWIILIAVMGVLYRTWVLVYRIISNKAFRYFYFLSDKCVCLSSSMNNKKNKNFDFEGTVARCIIKFNQCFPLRSDKLSVYDAREYEVLIKEWRRIFQFYDIVQGYSTDGIYPMLADKRPYFAYEHGTIREIPFLESSYSRLTALSYRLANGVFITNADNISSSQRLGISEDSAKFLPHAFDFRVLHRYAGKRLHERKRNGVFKIISPCRQHWVGGDIASAKGNDRLIRAIAILMKDDFDIVVEMVEWGCDLEHSKKLISDLGLERFFVWLKPMRKQDPWDRYLNADVVVDQFLISSISGVSFEALALGCPVITYDDGISNKKFFGLPPPIVSCQFADQIANAIKNLLNNNELRLEIGKKSIQWIEDFHSPEVVANVQADAYFKFLQ